MAKFTPGPWTVGGGKNAGSPKFIYCDDKYAAAIAEVHTAIPEMRVANANLIAAAPEMYEALTKAIEWIEQEFKEIGGCDHSVGICMCSDYRMLDGLKATIAKAEGVNSEQTELQLADVDAKK